ncbi:hypothetical protein BJY04DRAFT_219986 [Aspergillus karnatakaensis]|uniref:uncharacterized protein n=1 Tax=Aspergillus karnatakaensis TaxID=1810916 RepID=UPI003CCE0E6F
MTQTPWFHDRASLELIRLAQIRLADLIDILDDISSTAQNNKSISYAEQLIERLDSLNQRLFAWDDRYTDRNGVALEERLSSGGCDRGDVLADVRRRVLGVIAGVEKAQRFGVEPERGVTGDVVPGWRLNYRVMREYVREVEEVVWQLEGWSCEVLDEVLGLESRERGE